jgi:hypothetical protein
MREKLTFKGDSWRVQIAVWDFRNCIPALRKEQVTFSVTALPSSAKRATAFSCGLHDYYGPSLTAALKHAQLRLHYPPQLPEAWLNEYAVTPEELAGSGSFEPHKPCSHDELRWGRKREIIGGVEITVCGRCREEIPPK